MEYNSYYYRNDPSRPSSTSQKRGRSTYLETSSSDLATWRKNCLAVWPSVAVPSQRKADRLTTNRRILFFLTESVWPSIAVPSQRTFLTVSVWPSSALPSQRGRRVRVTAEGLTTDRRILLFLTVSVWPSSVFFCLCFGLLLYVWYYCRPI